MAFDAPLHIEGVDLVCEGHLVDPTVTSGASDPLVNVDAVVEVNKIGQIVDTSP